MGGIRLVAAGGHTALSWHALADTWATSFRYLPIMRTTNLPVSLYAQAWVA